MNETIDSLRDVPAPWSLTSHIARSHAVARLRHGDVERAVALDALERQLRLLAAIGPPDWQQVPESLEGYFGFVVEDLARHVPTLGDATPERFAELLEQRGYAPDDLVTAAEPTRRAFVHSVLNRSSENAARFLLAEPGDAIAGRLAALVPEHAVAVPTGLADTLLTLLRLDLGERALPALETVAGDPDANPALVATARELLRELGRGAPMRAVVALDHLPGADPLRSWLQQVIGAPDQPLYDAADALERADGEPQEFASGGPYGIECPFSVRVRRTGGGAELAVDFPLGRDPRRDRLGDMVSSAGRMLRADVGVAAPGAELERELAAARAPRGPYDVPPVLWASASMAPAFANAAEVARSAQLESDGSTLMLGR